MPSHDDPVSLLVLNTYLIPNFYITYLNLFGDKYHVSSCRDQDVRARRVADLVRTHDLSCLQEVWGGGSFELQSELDEEQDLKCVARNWKGFFGSGVLADLGNSAWGAWNKTGGLFHAYKKPAAHLVWYKHHTYKYNVGEEFLNKSVSFQVYDVSTKWGPKAMLLLVNTHLHSPNPYEPTKARREQRNEIIQELEAMVRDPILKGMDWSRCGGLLVGDLNTASALEGTWDVSKTPSSEYLQTLELFDAIDLFIHNDSPGPQDVQTFSKTNSYVDPKALKDAARMDYVLALGSLPNGDQPRIKLMPLKAKRCDVLVPEYGEEPADHHAQSVLLLPKKP